MLTKTRPKIGIVSVWFNRGAGHIALQVKNSFQNAGHDVSVFARMSATDGYSRIAYTKEFFHNDIHLHPTYQISDIDFSNWILNNKIDKIIFIEEHFTKNLIEVCINLKKSTYNYIVWENINPGDFQFYKKFTTLLCPTYCTYHFLKKAGLSNISCIPWGLDIHNKFRYLEPVKKEKPQFLFLDGWGGAFGRKNEEAVNIAFSEIVPRNKSFLRIHTQKAGKEIKGLNFHKTFGDMDFSYLLELYRNADIVLVPSRWEGNGLQQLEALCVGRPVIAVNAPPMNERIAYGLNGYHCAVKNKKTYPGIFVDGVDIDIEDLEKHMIELSEDKELLYKMQTTSRKIVELDFDWCTKEKKLLRSVLDD